MNAKVTPESSTRSVIEISLSAAEVAETRAAVAKEYAAQAELPGFRPGKAPVALVERKFGARIGAAAAERAIRESFDKAVKENSLDILEVVSSDPADASEAGGLAAKFTVDLVPKFDLPKLDGIPVDDADTKVTDEEVAKNAESIRRSRGTHVPMEDGGVLVKDDAAHVDYAGTLDGKPLDEAVPAGAAFAKRENAYFAAGSEYSIIPGLADSLVGRKPGESYEYDAEFPADFYVEELRGKKVQYAVTVRSAEKFVLPELDEAYFKGLGVADAADLDKRLRESMEARAKAADRARRINQIAKYLGKAVSFELPKAELERRTEAVLADLLRVNMDKGVAKEDLSKERERLQQAAAAQAAERMRIDFVLDAVARERKIELSGEQFNEYLNYVVRSSGMSAAEVNKLAHDRDALRAHHRAALRERTLESLLETAAPTAGVSL